MLGFQQTELKVQRMLKGACLECADCNGACLEIMELLTVPPRVLKAKGK